jgi:hypothetical protein
MKSQRRVSRGCVLLLSFVTALAGCGDEGAGNPVTPAASATNAPPRSVGQAPASTSQPPGKLPASPDRHGSAATSPTNSPPIARSP